MRNALIIAAAALALATPSVARDYSHDLFCSITDIGGNRLTYAFANNSFDSEGGTYVETLFSKNGRDVVSPNGSRPIWYWSTKSSFALITSDAADGWGIIVTTKVVSVIDGSNAWYAELLHTGHSMGKGACARPRTLVNEDGSVITDKAN